MNKTVKKLFMLSLLAAAAACQDEPLAGSGGVTEAGGRIEFRIEPPVSAEVEVSTRAVADPNEKAIYTLRIMIFDSQGNLIPEEVFKLYDRTFSWVFYGKDNIGSDGNIAPGAVPYDHHQGFSIPVLPETVTYTATADDGTETTETYYTDACTVWVLANMGRWENSLVNHVSGDINSLEQVKTIADLRRFYGKRTDVNLGQQRPFLPMVGTIHGSGIPVVDLEDNLGVTTATCCPAGSSYVAPTPVSLQTATAAGSYYTIELDQIVTKVRFNVSVAEGYEFYFDEWTVENLPRYTYILPHKRDIYEYVNTDSYTHYSDAEMAFLRAGQGFTYGADGKAVASGEAKTMFYPYGGEEDLMLHNGFGDGSVSEEDWIGPTGTSPNEAASKDPDEKIYITSENGNYYYFFYTYGNRRGGRRNEPNTGNLSGTNYAEDYQTAVTDNADSPSPLYKTLYAPDNASFLILRGMVRHAEADGSRTVKSVAYKIALGSDLTGDYNLYRNTCYTYYIHIAGFSQNDLKVSFDENSYNSSVHQRYGLTVNAPEINRIDCHYDMRYIQLLAAEGRIDIALYADEAEAKKCYDAANNVIDRDADYEKVAKVGSGNQGTVSWLKLSENKDAYCIDNVTDGFTNKTYNQLVEGTTEKQQTAKNLYVYAGEYVSASTDADGNVADADPVAYYETNSQPATRSAWLQIRHRYDGMTSTVLRTLLEKNPGYFIVAEADEDSDGTKETYVYTFLEIKQYGPLVVNYNNTKLLVECFEEYAMHLDPEENNETSQDGLPWGWGYIQDDYHDFSSSTSADNGLSNTRTIYETSCGMHNAEVADWVHQDYAARYCYYKSKRGSDGLVTAADGNWYLPALNELNAITSTTSGVTNVADKIYFSSTVPTMNEVNALSSNIIAAVIQYIIRWLGNNIQEWRDMARGAMNGNEKIIDGSYTSESWPYRTYTFKYYPFRTDKYHVRAVRVAPSSASE